MQSQLQVAVVCLALASTVVCHGQTRLVGSVHDLSGAAIANAEVELRAGNVTLSATTNASGNFELRDAPESGMLTVRAAGFATWSKLLAADSGREISIVLLPASVATELTVSATRSELPIAAAPASVQVVTSEQIHTSAAIALDDVLRQVAGFDLFRRTSSNFSNPTTQGVSLRGVGSSGASRAAVLVDGIPLNDPFGGWVYWDRVPRESISSVELLRGGASALYGSNAMGGVIDVRTREATQSWLAADVNYGSLNTPEGSIGAGLARGNWSATAACDAFSTDGYVMVDPAQRGAVDVRADSSHKTAELALTRKLTRNGNIFGRGSWFREERGNGTPLQVNDTVTERGVAGGDFTSNRAGSFSFRAYGGPEIYHQSFSSIALDRNSESLTRLQRVPVQELGASAQWSRLFARRHLLVAGADIRDIRGHSFETGFSTAGIATSIVDAGGRQRTTGWFVEDVFQAGRLTLNAAVRFDRWRNFDSFSDTRSLTTNVTILTPLTARTESAISPRAGANVRLTSSLSFTASAYRSFRAPTLNEIYRAFRVGNILTDANSNLRAEHLTGGEMGLVAKLATNIVARGEFFWNHIDNPIANVTLATTAALITRQRQNLGSTRSAGFEAQVEGKLSRAWSLAAGYQYAASVVTSFSAEPALVGLWVPQVPRQQFTFAATYDSPRLFTASVQLRASGQQFDDDLNQFPLESYARLDAFFSRRITSGLQAFIAAENLLDQRYSVGRTPVRTIAAPVTVRAGLRLQLPHR